MVQVWDGSWEYTADNEPCMKIWFDPAKGNPNHAVFKIKMNSIHSVATVLLSEIQSGESSSMSLLSLSLIFIFMLVIMLSMFVGYIKMRQRFRRGSLIC